MRPPENLIFQRADLLPDAHGLRRLIAGPRRIHRIARSTKRIILHGFGAASSATAEAIRTRGRAPHAAASAHPVRARGRRHAERALHVFADISSAKTLSVFAIACSGKRSLLHDRRRVIVLFAPVGAVGALLADIDT